MPIQAGTRLGPYEIVAPLGAGGMGEVYRARDTRLGREVAIKVLPAELAADPDRLRRFEQEAKTVSALNHPHIVTLYEVGEGPSGPYLVLEKIEGHSLRELLRGGALPVKRVLALGAQIAEGLAKAHAAGIVHRDLKPENIMVTDDGFAKILDFGLAKLVYPELEGGASHEMTTLVERTESGMILGTLGYLSPEQASGRPADFRSDQFALGALLYELATGDRPFRRETTPESLAAVIREEPESLRTKNAALPPQLGWIVERCLEKDPNDRYGSTRDLARDLADLRDHLSEIGRGAAAAPAEGTPSLVRGKLLWAVAGLAAGAALAAVAAKLLAGPAAGTAAPSYRPLTSRLGVVTGARFAPDGKTIYYSAAFGAEPSRVYVTRLESAESQLLDLPPAILRSVSSKGELALILTEQREATNAQGTLARVSPLGGTPRALIDDAVDADWAPDGEQLAVVRNRTERRLEFPIGKQRSAVGALFPRVSPAGDKFAFYSALPSAIEIHGLDGRTILRHEIPFVYGMAWKRSGDELWFTGSEDVGGTDRALYALSLDGKRRLLARAPGALNLYDVAPDGRSALVATGSGRIGIVARGPGASIERSLDLFGRTQLAGLSADGRFVLVSEEREIGRGAYLLSSDGAQTVRLGEGEALGLSPDGAWALLLRAGEPPRLVLVPTGAGAEREVPLDAALTPIAALWSRDGRRLFVAMNRQADRAGAFRVYLREGERPWRAVTPEGTPFFAVSSDGAWVAARDTQGAFALHPVGGGAPRALPEAQGFLRPIHWSRDGRWLVLRQSSQLPAKLFRLELATGRVEPWREFAPADPAGAILVMDQRFSDDESSYAYSVLRVTQELFLVEGLK